MSEFDKIIGYDTIKADLRQLCDMIHNMPIYEKLGAKMPKGLLLHGNPGVGKSLMARSFIEESGRKSFIIRRNKPDGDFINEIKAVFTEAAQNAPSIILLDDMDKFVVEDKSKEEYVAVQACIDEVVSSDVYVVATANDLDDIPDSLLRAGRFDRKIRIRPPQGDDSMRIIQHYMTSKSVVGDINVDDIAKMLQGKSCAELETILNEAAIFAGYERCEKISMEHIVHFVLRNEYGLSDSYYAIDTPRLERAAYHEAGHVVVSEVLDPNGVGLVSIRTCGKGECGGFVQRCKDWKNSTHSILMTLAGKAAIELKFGVIDEGASTDLDRATNRIKDSVTDNGVCGIGMLDVFRHFEDPSNILRARQEAVVQAELERYLLLAKEILVKNRVFLDTVASALLERDTLLNSDICKLRESCDVVTVAAGTSICA